MNRIRVSICIATYRRPRGLERLLRGLSSLEFYGARPEICLVVVDNHGSGSGAEDVVAGFRERFDECRVSREPRQGISYARNRALDLSPDCDFVAMIDDDEEPTPRWLQELLDVQAETDADVVTGPVLPRFDTPPPQWILDGGFFDAPRHATGDAVDLAFTGNVLFRYEPYGAQMRFSEKYARSGSSDTHFFRTIHQRDGRIVWADNAVVYEWQPPSRYSLKWLLQRQYRVGLTCAIIDEELRRFPHPKRRILKEARVRFTDGLRRLARHPFGPTHEHARALTRMAGGVGRLAALAGMGYEEYQG